MVPISVSSAISGTDDITTATSTETGLLKINKNLWKDKFRKIYRYEDGSGTDTSLYKFMGKFIYILYWENNDLTLIK